MGSASVVSLEAFRQSRVEAELRQRVHERCDAWLDEVEGRVNESRPPLAQIVQEVFARRQALTGLVTAGLVEQRPADVLAQETAVCPGCGRLLGARGPQTRTVETLVGEVRVCRPSFYCVGCQAGLYPLDEALGVSGHRKQADLQKAAASLAAEVPYETASALFAELTGLSVSAQTAHQVVGALTEGLTVLAVSPTAEEIQHKVAGVAEGKTWQPIVVLAIEGADVPTRPATAKGRRPGRKQQRAHRARWQGAWREAKGFRFYVVDGGRIEHVVRGHQVQTEDELAGALRQVKEAGVIPEAAVRLCVIADGAKGIWKHVKALFPSAVEVLDYDHCSEHLHTVAAAQYGQTPEREQEWLDATMTRLFAGEVRGVLWGLQRMKAHDAQAAEAIRTLLTSLETNQERVNDGRARKGGYPIGSGGIESANTLIAHVRLKRSGAWWYVEKANQMLALRCAKYNGTFNRIFEAYTRKIQHSQSKTPS